jgi:hypothetical protein
MTHVVYGLLALGLVTGLPAILAVIANYVKRRAARGTYLDAHFRWQIRTFWFGLLWLVIALVLAHNTPGAVCAGDYRGVGSMDDPPYLPRLARTQETRGNIQYERSQVAYKK